METLLKNLVARLKAYGATYDLAKYGGYGYIILGEVRIEVEINIRRVARIEGRRFLHGSRRGYDVNDMVMHILTRLPLLQERAKRDAEYKAKKKTHAENEQACTEYTKMIDDKRVNLRYDEYARDGYQFSLLFKCDSPTTAMVAADMVREIEDHMQPRLLNQSTETGPRQFSYCDENGDPNGSELSLKGIMATHYTMDYDIDFDQLIALIVGETMYLGEFRIIRIA